MRRKTTGMIAALLIIVLMSALFTGCANKILYGKWKVEEMGDPDTMQGEAPFFPITVTLHRDGSVDLLDSPFGEVKRSRQQFEFQQTSGEEGEEQLHVTGGWELRRTEQGIELYVFPDDQKVYYKLVRLAE